MAPERVAGPVLAAGAVAEMLGRLRFEPGEAHRLGMSGGQAAGVSAVLLLMLLCLLGTLPLAFLRPVAAAVTIYAASLVLLGAFGLLTVAGAAAVLIAAYVLGRRGSRVLAVASGVPFAVFGLAGSGEVRLFGALLACLAPTAALAGGARRASGEARLLGMAREATAGSLAEHMARGERARIARELHDVVAHHISMVAVQAETARLTTPGLPAMGEKRFCEIGDTARAGLTEMRRLLGVLREDASVTEAQRRPQPGLSQLNGLLDSAREASGAGIRLIVSGPVAELDQGVELAAFRIIQEALTNARRHAPGAAVDVELRYGADRLHVRVRDNGPGPSSGPVPSAGLAPGPAAGTGHGLLGMRERAVAAGGSLTAGAAPGGGFLIDAMLPVGAPSLAARVAAQMPESAAAQMPESAAAHSPESAAAQSPVRAAS
jgi:signal transduction histidine kinase